MRGPMARSVAAGRRMMDGNSIEALRIWGAGSYN